MLLYVLISYPNDVALQVCDKIFEVLITPSFEHGLLRVNSTLLSQVMYSTALVCTGFNGLETLYHSQIATNYGKLSLKRMDLKDINTCLTIDYGTRMGSQNM